LLSRSPIWKGMAELIREEDLHEFIAARKGYARSA
jgi:hypothetical protein